MKVNDTQLIIILGKLKADTLLILWMDNSNELYQFLISFVFWGL